MKFRNFRAVLTVAETGTVSEAARRLHLSQPAITHAVRQVEAALGVPIFERQRTGMALTDIGDIVVRRVKRTLKQLYLAENEIDRNPDVANAKRQSPPLHKAATYRHLTTLSQLADSRDVRLAARRIGVTEPAVYRSLRELETIVGSHLMHRRQNMIPTPAGEVMIRRAKLALAELRHMEDEIGLYFGRMSGRVTIGTLPSSRTMLVPRAIAVLSNSHPHLRFSMIDGPYDTMLCGLRCGDIDIMVGAVHFPPPVDDVSQEVLFEGNAAILARKDHPIARKDRVALEDLARAGWVVPRLGAPTRSQFQKLFEDAGMAVPSNVVETDSFIATRALLLENDRLTMLLPSRATFELDIGVLVRVPYEIADSKIPFGFTVRTDAYLSPGVRAFIEQLRQIGLDAGSTRVCDRVRSA